MLGSFITALHDPLAAWPVSLVIFRDAAAAALILGVLLVAARFRLPAPGRITRLALGAVALLAVAADIFILAAYPFGIAYNDHAEPTVTMIGWWWLHGHVLYPDWDRGEGQYGLIYGPLNFQLIGTALRFGQSVFASKLPGVLAGGLTIAALGFGLREMLPRRPWFRILLLGAMVTMIAAFGSIGFWNRPEPFLLACTSLGLVVAVRLRGLAACIVIGVLTGLATGFKLTAPLYFIGFALGLLAAEPGWPARLRMAGAGSLVWLGVTALPFLDPVVSIHGYAKYFVMASEHGQNGELLLLNILLGAVLLLPLLVMRWRSPADSWVAGGMVAGLLVAGFVGSKPGAGPHHLLPFLPCFAYLACRAYARQEGGEERDGVAAAVFVVLMLTHGPAALKQMRSIGGLIVRDQALELREAQEVAELSGKTPGAVMGQGGNAGYRAAFHRVQTAFHGAPVALLEVPAWMEMEKAGASGQILDAMVAGCAVHDWIIPNAGRPFSISGTYVHDRSTPIMSDTFRRSFMANYRPGDPGAYFTLWSCVTK